MPQPPRQDDDDWSGTPPEGRHTRAQSDPGYWARQWQTVVAGGVVMLVLLVILAIVLLT